MQKPRARRRPSRPTTVAFDHTDRFVSSYLESLDTPLSRRVLSLYRGGSHMELLGISIDPRQYTDPFVFRRDFAAVSFLSKGSDVLRLDADRRKVAIEKFLKAEELCAETNRRFTPQGLMGQDPTHLHLAFKMRAVIRKVLGDFNVEGWIDAARWGPGATTLIKRQIADYPTKFLEERGITAPLATLWHDCRLSQAYKTWRLPAESLVYQEGNKVVTVPKNAKTDRVIAIEPGLNLWFQLGLGTLIRRRLRKAGINLDDQKVNQDLARKGSALGHLATIDFSSASDTIALSVVNFLFDQPDLEIRKWFFALDTCRSRSGRLENRLIRWAKFSSMGNGYTFELESLIFYAAAVAVCDHLQLPRGEISVFGDDVVIPTAACSLFAEFTAFLGFRFNHEKSFVDGPFRESCGEYFFAGVDCKPIFLKERVNTHAKVYKTANAVRDQAHRWGFRLSCDRRFERCYRYLFEGVEPSRRFCSSLGYATDSAFVVNIDEALSAVRPEIRPHRSKFGWEGWFTSQLIRQPVWSKAEHEHEGVLSTALRYASTASTMKMVSEQTKDYLGLLENLSERERKWNRITGFKYSVRKVFVHVWYDLGPWVEIP